MGVMIVKMKIQTFIKNEYNEYLKNVKLFAVNHSEYVEYSQFASIVLKNFQGLMDRIYECFTDKERKYANRYIFKLQAKLAEQIQIIAKTMYKSEYHAKN